MDSGGAGSSTAAGLQAVVVCGPASGNPLRLVGGISLLERILRQLSGLDSIGRILVIKPAALQLPPPSRRVTKTTAFQDVDGATAWEMLRDARAQLDDRFIVLAADYLIDQRLIAWLAAHPHDVMLAARDAASEPAGRLSRNLLDAADPKTAGIETVAVSSLPSYWESMHGEVQLHLHRVTTDRDAEAAWPILLDHVQRRAQELPSQYFDIPFENFLVRRLAGTAITANQVTILTTLLGFVVAALYFTGWLRIGVLLAIFVEVLDGVDGKLARVTRTTSRAGELEHVADFFYENACYLALGAHFSSIGLPHAWFAAIAMVLFDLTDTLAYAAMDVWWGVSLDNANPWLTRFRMIGGRRNIYNWLFLFGFYLGSPGHTFYFTSAWAGITASIHAAWVISEGMSRKRAALTTN
jgi:hypothetical protein